MEFLGFNKSNYKDFGNGIKVKIPKPSLLSRFRTRLVSYLIRDFKFQEVDFEIQPVGLNEPTRFDIVEKKTRIFITYYDTNERATYVSNSLKEMIKNYNKISKNDLMNHISNKFKIKIWN